ncbi:hypothetical protein AB6E39_05855 [Vibrio splendidus]|jgi:hypothetical protein|nr:MULTISPECIES: hypothetical protein [Vibrio]MCC4787499.1 hypothetical protein [Vibrio splendidus]
MIPTNFDVSVNTPEPVTVKIDVTERTIILVSVVAVIAGAVVIKLKK